MWLSSILIILIKAIWKEAPLLFMGTVFSGKRVYFKLSLQLPYYFYLMCYS